MDWTAAYEAALASWNPMPTGDMLMAWHGPYTVSVGPAAGGAPGDTELDVDVTLPASLPSDWPADVRGPPGGALTLVQEDPHGGLSAAWTTSTPPEEVRAAFAKALVGWRHGTAGMGVEALRKGDDLLILTTLTGQQILDMAGAAGAAMLAQAPDYASIDTVTLTWAPVSLNSELYQWALEAWVDAPLN